MTGHIKGQGRHQATLLPEVLDDFIDENNPVRVIDAFVEGLQLEALGFESAEAKLTGRPGYHPAILLKLYLYGYLNRIQSSRRLEKESHRNVELMWLLQRLTPDFRKNNGKGIKNACKTFIELCRQMNLFTDVIVAIDGSKFKAVNSKPNNFTPKKTEKHIERVEQSIQTYLNSLDEADKNNQSNVNTELMNTKLQWLKQKLIELQDIQVTLEQLPDKQLSRTDPDSRLMKTNHMNRQVCYNVQTAVDTKHHLIVAHEVTNKADRGQLLSVTKLAQEAVGQKAITIIADKGYYSCKDIKAIQDEGAKALVPKSDTSGADSKGPFNRSIFIYDPEKDVYTCPAGNELQNRFISIEAGLELQVYFNNEAEMEDMQARLDSAPETAVLRKQTVEHPFGTIKMWMGATHFLTRRFKNVSTEMNLHVLAYNFKRMLSIFGVETLLQKLQGLCSQ